MHLTLPVDSALSALVGPAFFHGFADMRKPCRHLWPYLTLFLPFPSSLTTLAFACASVVHFGRDVGMHASTALHIALVTLALANHAEWATTMLLIFMNAVHIPKRVGDDPLILMACGIAAAFMATVLPCDTITLSDVAQKLVVAHVVVNDLLPHPDDASG